MYGLVAHDHGKRTSSSRPASDPHGGRSEDRGVGLEEEPACERAGTRKPAVIARERGPTSATSPRASPSIAAQSRRCSRGGSMSRPWPRSSPSSPRRHPGEREAAEIGARRAQIERPHRETNTALPPVGSAVLDSKVRPNPRLAEGLHHPGRRARPSTSPPSAATAEGASPPCRSARAPMPSCQLRGSSVVGGAGTGAGLGAGRRSGGRRRGERRRRYGGAAR